ncbi:phosphotransferase [Paenibacillus guangzhouensis]|uniref:phosphotransferase n=1 Tax=Paenibacillus guangzhouensis TaxID=1473112 RepID=UPI0012669704|nr:phosphotransferase [Paenibacillus guangzhouensis]
MYTQPIALRSVLDPNYLKYCLSDQYDVGDWQECTYWLRGLNDTYRLRTSCGDYILRIYRQAVDESDVAYELSLLLQLRNVLGAGTTQVSEPIAQKDNTFYSVIHAPEGERVVVLFRYLYGSENLLHDENSCYAFGRSAAELHTAMDQVNMQSTRINLDTDFLIRRPLERIISYIGENHESTSFLRLFANALIERISETASQGLDWGICHGDMHGNNNAFQEGDTFTHYDFEWSALGWRAYDLAQVRGRKRQRTERKDELWQAFMAGYRSIREFSEQDESAIELFLMARRFWVMGLDVAFVPNDTGALDFLEDWLQDFVQEFRDYHLVTSEDIACG